MCSLNGLQWKVIFTHNTYLTSTVMNVSFRETSLSVSEGGGFFELTLVKTEGAVGPVTVNLITIPGPGSEGEGAVVAFSVNMLFRDTFLESASFKFACIYLTTTLNNAYTCIITMLVGCKPVYICELYYHIAGYILAGIMFGGLLERGRILQLVDINLAVTYDHHAFSRSLHGWRNIAGFNIAALTRNPPIRQI